MPRKSTKKARKAPRMPRVKTNAWYRFRVNCLCEYLNTIALIYHSGSKKDDESYQIRRTRWDTPFLVLESYENGKLEKTVDIRSRYQRKFGGCTLMRVRNAEGMQIAKCVMEPGGVFVQRVCDWLQVHFQKIPYVEETYKYVGACPTGVESLFRSAEGVLYERYKDDERYVFLKDWPDESNVRRVGFITREFDDDGKKIPFEGVEARFDGQKIVFDCHDAKDAEPSTKSFDADTYLDVFKQYVMTLKPTVPSCPSFSP